MGPLTALIKKEFIQFFRSKPLVILVIWTIAVEIAICAYAITYDVTHIRLAVRDLDGSPASRELTARFTQTVYFDARYRPQSPRSSTGCWRPAGRPSAWSSRQTFRASSDRGSRPPSSFSWMVRTPTRPSSASAMRRASCGSIRES